MYGNAAIASRTRNDVDVNVRHLLSAISAVINTNSASLSFCCDVYFFG